MDVLHELTHSLLPLTLLVLLGAALMKGRFFTGDFRRQLDRLMYWVALPALIVLALVDAPAEIGEAGRMTVAFTLATLVTLGLAVGWAWRRRQPRAAVGVFVQAAFRGNLGFVGLPVIALVSGNDAGVLARAALMFAPIMVVYNVLGVVILVAAQHRFDRSLPAKMAWSLLTNPLLIACGVGWVFWWLRVDVTEPGRATLELLARTAAPLALISLGGGLVSYPVGRHLPRALTASVLKCGVCPLAAWFCCAALGLDGDARRSVMVFAACPTAVASYVLATQLKGDTALASACIVVSTVVSGVSLGAVLAWG